MRGAGVEELVVEDMVFVLLPRAVLAAVGESSGGVVTLSGEASATLSPAAFLLRVFTTGVPGSAAGDLRVFLTLASTDGEETDESAVLSFLEVAMTIPSTHQFGTGQMPVYVPCHMGAWAPISRWRKIGGADRRGRKGTSGCPCRGPAGPAGR